MDIRCYEDSSGDPCYLVRGHVDLSEFERELSLLSDYGEDKESAGGYSFSHCYAVWK